MRLLRPLGLALGWLCGLSALAAEPAWHVPSVQIQKAETGVQVGSGSIRGRVVDVSSGQPLQGGVVEVRAEGGRLRLGTVTTSADGGFAFDDVPASNGVVIRATLAGYAGGIYGERSPIQTGDAPVLITLKSGDHLENLTLPLWQYASISGHVRGPSGAPAVGVTVRAWRQTHVAGELALAEGFALTGRTNDQGEYKLPQALAGTYVVAIPLTTGVPSPRFESVTRTLFFPATLRAEESTAIEVRSGDDIQGIDIDESASEARMWKVAGTAVGWASDRGALELELTRKGGPAVPAAEAVALTHADTTGQFAFPPVPQGEYLVKVLGYPSAAPGTRGMFEHGTGSILARPLPLSAIPAVPTQHTLWATVPVSVVDRDITNVQVNLQPGARIHGTTSFVGEPIASDQMALQPILVMSADGRDVGRVPVARLESDGQFSTAELPEGDYVLRPETIDWRLLSVRMGGQEVIGRPIHVASSDVTLQLTLSKSDTTGISGVVHDSTGHAIPASLVCVFPSDQTLWTHFGPDPPPLLTVVHPDRDGHYRARLVPGMEFFVVAVRELALDWKYPETLARLASSGSRVQLKPGGNETKDLQVR